MPMHTPELFGAALRQHREHAGLSQEVLAAHAGLSPNAVGALERGERQRPYPHTIRALAEALHLDPEQHARLVHLARARPPKRAAVGDLDVPALVETLVRTRTTRAHPVALPAAPNALIGRADELAAIVQAVTHPAHRLTTLVGPGGVGKTRLALAVATELETHFADGVAWVALASVAAADQVPSAIAAALQQPLRHTDPPADQLLAALRDCHRLLVLDNFEHLLEATDLLAMIVEHAPAVHLLVTSRERLRLTGEWAIELHGLGLPHAATAAEHKRAAAVRLFAERAQQAGQGFVVTAANHAAVARICRLLEGMPLGIELAAAWVGTLSLEEIAEEVARTLDFLARADRNAPLRHRSLRAVFDQSWRLLDDDQRQVLARLAVFRGGCTRTAAETVAGASLAVLAALVDKSLIRRTLDATGLPRYDLHELVRQYALDKLQADPAEELRTRARHGMYYARLLGEHTDALLSDRMVTAWTHLAPDLDNLRAAWAWAAEHGEYRALAQMGQSLYVISELRGLVAEGVAWFQAAATALRAVAASTAAPTTELVWTLGQILSLYGRCAAQAGRYGEARELLHEGYALLEQRGDLLLRAGTLTGLGYVTTVLGRYLEARTWLTECIGLARAHGEPFYLALGELMLALVAQTQGAADARALAEAGLDHWRALGNPRGLTTGLWAVSRITLDHGDIAAAEAVAQEELRLAAELQDRWASASALLQLGDVALARGATREARYLVEESVTSFTDVGEPWSRGRALVTLGWVAAAEGKDGEARQQWEQALRIAQAMHLDPVALDAQHGLASLMQQDAPAAALALLDRIITHPATTYHTRTRATAVQRAVLAGEPSVTNGELPAAPSLRIPETGETLTPREVEVLRLLAQGRSNQAIAQELIVAVGTVKRHLNNIFGKLHVQSRLHAVAHARDLGLL